MQKKRDPRALNAYRHGLTGQVQLISPADQVAYDIHCKGVIKNIGAGNEFETSVAQTVADDLWRFQESQAARQAALEKAVYEANLLAQLAASKGESYNIERDYPRDAIPPQFVFSNAEIAPQSSVGQALPPVPLVL